MNYSLMSSLEHMALVRTVIVLWNEEDVRDLVTEFYFWSRTEVLDHDFLQIAWRQLVENDVILKVQNLPVPELLKKKMLDFIKPIGMEILKWKEFHKEFLSDSFTRECLNRFCWTSQGTVDRKKTAEIMVKDENLDISRRYMLACIYSLEYDILKLWDQMSSNEQESLKFSNSIYIVNHYHPEYVSRKKLVAAWTFQITGDNGALSILMNLSDYSFYELGFEIAAKIGNKSSTEYFFKKLTPEERKKLLVRFAGYAAYYSSFIRSFSSCFDDVLCFLLSQMNNEQQTEVFKKYPLPVLQCLLNWPWQSLFMETTNRMWEFLSEEVYNYLLNEIADKVIEGYKDYNYQMLFREFWQQSSDDKRRYVVDECATWPLLLKLLEANDKNNVVLILEDATILQRKKIITSRIGMKICEKLIRENKWDILIFFVQECSLSSKEILVKFKDEFNKHIKSNDLKGPFISDDIWNKFFKLVDNLVQENNME